MLIKLCIDIWRDIFDWLSPSDRKRFARKFNKIGDREFSDLCQKWLHEWIKNVNLGYMDISQPPTIELTGGRLQCSDTRIARLNCFDKIPRRWREEVFPETELPDNIRDFERIQFCYLDSRVALFLHRLQPLFQAKEVNLYMHVDDKSGDQLGAALTALDHLVPLLNGGGIDTVTPAGHTSKLLVAIRDRFPAQFFGVKFFIIWLWTRIPTSELTELLLEWLGTGREDGQPRMLTLQAFNSAVWMLGFIERIRQQFTDATSHASFFITRVSMRSSRSRPPKTPEPASNW